MKDWLTHFIFSKAGILFYVLVALLILERAFPAVRLRDQLTRVSKNFSLAGLNIILSPFIVVPLTFFAGEWQVAWRPEWATGMVIDLALLDCWIYFWHRANHVIPFLWKFHVVHHLDENLDVSSALRFHFGEVALSSLVRAAVMIALAVPLTSVVVFETLVTIAAMFHHSNIRIPQWLEKPLSKIIVTPSIHFVHHHAMRADTDSNYATGLSIWDRIFGSRSAHARKLDMPMGVEGLHDVSLISLILRPFGLK